ncbi:MAG: oligosaccharide flippase family protein [Chlorobi bacterium]|nr:oligosaccharide flippase family protein [Chlorobiota bacterium]
MKPEEINNGTLHTLTKGFAIALLVSILIKPIWTLVIEPIVQNIVSSETFGLYFALLNLTFLLRVIAELGTNTVISRNIASGNSGKHWFFATLKLRLITGLIYLAIVGLSAWILGYSQKEIGLALLIALIHISALLFLLMKGTLEGLQKYSHSGLISSLPRLIMIVLAVVLILLNAVSILSFITIQIIGFALASFLIMAYLIRRLPADPKTSILNVIKASLPYALLGFIMTLYTRIDAVMLERLHPNGPLETGWYAGAYRFIDAMWMYVHTGAVMLIAGFARHQGNLRETTALMRWGVRFLALPVIAGNITLLAFAKYLMPAVYVDGTNMISIAQILSFAGISGAMGYVYSTYLTATGQTKFLNSFALITFLLNAVLNWILIPSYGALGAAIATVVAQAIFASLCGFKAIIIDRIYKHIDIADELRVVLWLLLISVVAYLLQFSPLNWVLNMTMFAIFSLLSLFLTGSLTLKDLRPIIRFRT